MQALWGVSIALRQPWRLLTSDDTVDPHSKTYPEVCLLLCCYQHTPDPIVGCGLSFCLGIAIKSTRL
jgi:hypothetical protein